MTTNLFKKAAIFTDIHYGLKNNSIIHNQDCDGFIDWFIALAKENNCETCMFLGDWHNNRASISLLTLNYSVMALEKLSKAFSQVFFIAGNHDLYYRDKRDITGVSWAKHFPNITIVDKWFESGDVIIAPWLVGDDFSIIKKKSAKYLFGHLELPMFMMNAAVEMPDSGIMSLDTMQNFESVFSGHFHIRQQKKNINYIGNAFPHNFSDAGDSRRGAMILEWGGKPTFHAWENQPLYNVFKLSDLLVDTDSLLKKNSYCRVNLDVDISYEEASFIKETFIEQYQLREMSLIPTKTNEVANDTNVEIKFESVNQIVTEQLVSIKSDFYDPALLIDIYNKL